MVRELLDQEIEAAKKIHESEISRANYDFVFLRQDKISWGFMMNMLSGLSRKERSAIFFEGKFG